jgi:hypothetical protein
MRKSAEDGGLTRKDERPTYHADESRKDESPSGRISRPFWIAPRISAWGKLVGQRRVGAHVFSAPLNFGETLPVLRQIASSSAL